MAVFEDTRLKIFMSVARLGSFTLAARECGISQPAVSQNISELEKLMGKSLFVRNRGSVELTAHGAHFMEYASQISFWYKAAREAFGEGLPSQLRPGESSRMLVRIGVGDGVECHFTTPDDHERDVELIRQGDDLRVSIIKKQRSLEDFAAGKL